jgi:hypothetical protein
MRIRKGAEPAAIIVRGLFGKPIEVASSESVRPLSNASRTVIVIECLSAA